LPDPSLWPSIISAASALGGAIIGAITGGFATYCVQHKQRREDRVQERRALAAGVVAEIESYIDIVTRRKHTEHAKGIVAELRSGKDIKLSTLPFEGLPVRELFPLFFSQLEKIGLLGDAASDLAKFYAQIAGVNATVRQFPTKKYDHLSIPERIQFLEEEIDLWESTLRDGPKHAPA
jgi:hypothetical protein